jgi:putative ABC transport system permease protein
MAVSSKMKQPRISVRKRAGGKRMTAKFLRNKHKQLRPSIKKVLRDFIENRSRSFLVIASITIGVFAVGMIGTGYLLLTQGTATSFAENNPAHITIATNPFDDSLVDMITRQDGVLHAEGRRTIPLKARNPGETDWKNLYVTIIQDMESPMIKLLSPLQGSAIPDDRSLVLLEDGNEEIGSQVGADLLVKLKDGTVQPFRISGITKDYTAGRDIILESKRAYASAEAFPALHEDRMFDTLVIRVSGDPYDISHIQSVATQLNKKIEDSGRTVYTSETKTDADQPFRNYVEAIGLILLFIGLLVIILSSSLIFNTMNALMAQHVRQIGVMKLIGAQRRVIILMYMVLVLIFGLISFLIAVPAGSFAGYLMSQSVVPVINGYLISTTVVPLFPAVILLQALVSLIIPIVAALFPILQGSRITVHKAFNSQKISNGNNEQSLDRFFLRFSFRDLIKKLSLRNTFRKKGRLILTLFTLSLGGAMFIAVFNVQFVLYDQINRIVSYDSADIKLTMSRDHRIEDIQSVISPVDGVVEVEGWWTSAAQLEVDDQIVNVSLIAPPLDSNMVIEETASGRWMQPGETNTLVVNDAFYNVYPDLEPGDSIPLKINGKTEDWTIVGTYNFTGFDDKRAYTTPDALMLRGSDPFHSSDFRISTKKHNLDYQDERVVQIQALLEQRGYKISSIFGMEDILETSTEKINILILVLLIMAIITGTVGGIGLSGTLSLNVLERTGEIGILRAIGAGNRVITRLVLQEGIVIGIASYLIGVLLSLPVSKLLGSLVVNAIFSGSAQFVISPRGYIYWLLLTLALSVIASLVPARSASRMTIRDVLAYE